MLVWSVGWMCFCRYYQNVLLSICIDYMLSIDVMYCRVVYTVHKVAAHCVYSRTAAAHNAGCPNWHFRH